MTSRFRPLTAVAVAALLAFSACSTSAPPTRLHSLMPAEPPPRQAAARGAPLFVALEPIRLPAQVDQPQWLVRLPDESLASLEQERWASPLRDELRQALLEQLAARFAIVAGRSAATPAAPPLRIALELRRFDSLPGREARIEGAWTVAGGAATLRCTLLVRETASGDMPELAAAHRRAVVRLADAIGASVVAAQAGSSAACPAGAALIARPGPHAFVVATKTARPSCDDRAACCRSSDQPARCAGPNTITGEQRSRSSPPSRP